VASLAILRALHVILGWRPLLLIPLTFALFSPLTLPAFAWWAAALNALPMVAAMAWVCADAIMLVRTGNQKYALSGALVFFLGLTFFEKAAVIPFVAFAVAALLAYVLGDRSAVKTVWRGGLRLWIATGALTAAWVGIYLRVVDQRRWTLDDPMTGDLLVRSVTHGIVPGLIGGPWQWERWAPSSPWALPQWPVMVVGWVVLAAVIAVSVARFAAGLHLFPTNGRQPPPGGWRHRDNHISERGLQQSPNHLARRPAVQEAFSVPAGSGIHPVLAGSHRRDAGPAADYRPAAAAAAPALRPWLSGSAVGGVRRKLCGAQRAWRGRRRLQEILSLLLQPTPFCFPVGTRENHW
jgi:hypothetical protein